FDGRVALPALANWFEHLLLCVHLGVTRHTNLGRWHCCEGGALHVKVTISTIKAETAHMVFVGKLHRLNHMVPLPRHQSGLVPEKCGAKRRTGEKNQRSKRGFHLIIDVFMKYLRQG